MHKGLKKPENARVLYLDMNSFFASVEQQKNPLLRDKPLAVVSHVGPAGTALAASYEAKAFGIKTGTRLKEAWQLCPDLITVPCGHTAYRAVHKQFMAILRDLCGPEVYPRSIDEAVIPLSPNWYGSEKAHALAREIKRRFRAELGECIRCSIGIAPNSFLAKVATNLQKPDGLVEITLESAPAILSKMRITDLPGIATRMAAKLSPWGITTPLELYDADADTLRRQFGVWGQQWWWKLHGYEPETGITNPIKSMSHQHALEHWITETEAIEPALGRMADRLIHRLRRNGYQCKRAGIFLSLKGRKSIAVERVLDATNQTYAELWDTIYSLFRQLPRVSPAPIRLVGIWFTQLVPAGNGYQMDLFAKTERNEQLSQALEKVRFRHGFESIQRGTVIRLDPAIAAERLGFGRIKDL